MIISPHPQRSPEWFQERLGLPTASNFKRILSPKTAKKSESKEGYLNELAGEIQSGRTTERYVSYKMKLASEREPKARAQYEFMFDVDVQEVGLCYKDASKMYGMSPDGLIGEPGGFETKDAEPHIQTERLRYGWDEKAHYPQVQGGLLVSGREWWDVMSFCEGMTPIIHRIYRDEPYIARLEEELHSFCFELAGIVKKLKER